MDEFDEFTAELQNQIDEETKETFGKVVFNRWLNPRYMGRIENPDGYARITGSCGDTMEIFLRFEKDRVKEAAFQTDGCGPSVVCGSFAAELSLGKGPEEVTEITGETILDVLGGLPEENRHCAFLAAETLMESLDSYMKNQAGKESRPAKETRK